MPEQPPPDPAPVLIDDHGVEVDSPDELLLDLRFDDRRIWSFWLHRDGTPVDGHRWRVPWPPELVRFLDGVTEVRLGPREGPDLLTRELRFGSRAERIAVVDQQGRQLGLDKSGRMVTTFDTRDRAEVEGVLDALETALGALGAAGVPAFPAYGTLLGAVRDGRFIGHDSDADVAYVSAFSDPVDVIRESFRLQRAVTRAGLPTTRYSGAAFRIDVTESDGTPRGLDVFGGFFTDGHLAMMGEVFQPFAREWILPLGTTVLEGRTLPAPARPERLLEAMYGASWRRPDPAFRFTTPDSTKDRFNAWFRGTRVFRNGWDRRWATAQHKPVLETPHSLARVVHRREPAGTLVVDVGCGRGRDALWLARQGHRTIGLDYSHVAFDRISREVVGDLPVTLASLNLLELRSTLAWGSRLAHQRGRCAVMARHVLDAMPPQGRRHFWRLCEMALRHRGSGGGRLYLEVLTSPPEPHPDGPPLLECLDPDELVESARSLPGVVSVERRDLVGRWVDVGYGEEPVQKGDGRTTRLQIQWS